MKIKFPEFSDQLEIHIRTLDETEKVPYNVSKAYFILRGLKEDVSFFPAMYRVHLDEVPQNIIFAMDISEWIEDWRMLWPTPRDLSHEYGVNLGYDIRCSKKAVERKMKTFLKEFHMKFSEKLGKTTLQQKKEFIMDATKLYLTECKEKGWMYTKKSMYFIEKEGDSLLEKYIWRILNNERVPETQGQNFYIN